MEIRRAQAADAERISRLIKSVARYFTLHPEGEGAEGFLLSIEPEAIQAYVTAPEFTYFVGERNGDLIGAVAIRNNAPVHHLHHLFVAPDYHRRGLAKALWEHARTVAEEAGNLGRFTVNSSPFAVPVYESFGFRATGPRVETKGIAFVPMALDEGPSPGAAAGG